MGNLVGLDAERLLNILARSPSSLLIASSRSLVGLATPMTDESNGWLGARLFCCLSATAQEKKISHTHDIGANGRCTPQLGARSPATLTRVQSNLMH